MFQLDDKFLEEVGLGGLPDEQKQAFLAYFREQLELRVGTKLSEGLSDAQLEEFEHFIDRDEEKVNAWIAANVPDYQDDQVWQQLKSGAPADMPEIAVKSEYASLKWLGINRPDYRDVVAGVMQELREETIKNRDAILGSGASASGEADESAPAAA
ncbi:hypothetical protein CR983_03705 [Candidatus Saccharibacteria bacterium]|nr:MAG: hypothetical protein CR983_03705 [Candidatus Saccharibacteria bacterium]